MFVFGSETDGVFTLVQNSKEHVYTWVSEPLAMEYFPSAKHISHLYQFQMDLSGGTLIKQGDNTLGCPDVCYLTEEQKHNIFTSFPYPSLLQWAPLDQTIEVES